MSAPDPMGPPNPPSVLLEGFSQLNISTSTLTIKGGNKTAAGVWAMAGGSAEIDPLKAKGPSVSAAVVAFSPDFQGVVGETNKADGVLGLSHSPLHAGVSAINDAGGFGVWASSSNQAGHFEGNVQITGDLTVFKDIFLANEDCAEEFEIAGTEAVDAGTVMVMDDAGQLRPSRNAYDTRVAGVIAGAGDYKPGLILGKREFPGTRQPLSLLGRAYCKVDARDEPIKVGDLLTTSATPGHAMKASNQARAFGAVIGKAMRSLDSGLGLVPILIALQ